MADKQSVSPNPAPATPVPEKGKGTFVPLIFGGAVACALGFFGAQIDTIEERLGLGGTSELEALVARQSDQISAQSAEIDALSGRVAAAEAIEIPQIPEVDLSGVTSSLEAQVAALDALAARVSELEKRPLTENVSTDAIEAYEAELQRLQASVEVQRDEIEGLIDEARLSEATAAEQAQRAAARAAMSQIITAVDAGVPFASALAELQNTGDVTIPSALSQTAAEGVPTLASLQDAFPQSARAALAAVRTDPTGGSVAGFFQRQLGVRSVTPREGSDPDAVLSRAEAALRDARLGDVLAELTELPDDARAQMSDWITRAETRHAASLAADELMTALATN